MYTQLRGPPTQESRGLNLPAYLPGKNKNKDWASKPEGSALFHLLMG